MKLFKFLAVAAIMALGVNAFAQAPAKKGIKITKITGTVNILKDGVVVMTLKPGDAIPEIQDTAVTFAIVDGTVELQADGKTVTAATGSNFTVAIDAGKVNVAVAAGTPVAVKSESGHNVVMTANSAMTMTRTDGKVEIAVEKGNAVMTDASGGGTQTLKAGQEVMIPAAPMAGPAPTQQPQTPVPTEPAGTEPVVVAPIVVEPPPVTVIPTQTVLENEELSPSNP